MNINIQNRIIGLEHPTIIITEFSANYNHNSNMAIDTDKAVKKYYLELLVVLRYISFK